MAERINPAQRETLRVMGDGEWYDFVLVSREFRERIPTLVKRCLMETRGERAGRQVRVTDAGRALLKAELSTPIPRGTE